MSDDASLRRMVYLFIKEVAETCDPDDVIIVTSSLTKDMTCDVDLYRANALRVLARIIDAAMLGAIERYVKQALVDSSGMVSSAALVSALHLFDSAPENAAIVRRWIGETQEATTSPHEMVQFHAIQLLYQIKCQDRLAISKLVQQFSQKNTLRSPLAVTCLVRYTAKLLQDEMAAGRHSGSIQDGTPILRGGYAFLVSCLRHRADMVTFEAARAICNLPSLEPQDLAPAIGSLQAALSSPQPAMRFATMKTLAAVAGTHPRVVSKCNEDLEALIADSNRSVATLAITTLLKTGSENSIDRLLKQISAFLTDIADEYKITVVRSLQQLCVTYPSRHRVIVGFLSNFLREEGGFDFKRSIVAGIVHLMRQIPEMTETSLLHLCEFIEDCEFTLLSTQILQLLGEMGPTTPAPARYIRFLYNRVLLENAAVRAAAISALAKFAARCPSLRPSILALMRPGLVDEDDEARDRAALAVRAVEEAMERFPCAEPEEDDAGGAPVDDEPEDGDPAAFLLLEAMPLGFDKLERSVRAYVSAPAAMSGSEALTFASLPILEDLPEEEEKAEEADQATGIESMALAVPEPEREKVDPAAVVYAIPELASLGRVFRSSQPAPLTESETEYVVECVRHVFEGHVVLQFIVQNTIDDQRLDNVTVAVESDDGIFEAAGEIAAECIKYGDTANCFTVLQRNMDVPLATSNFTCELHFTVVQVDPATGEEEGEGFEEEYPLEDLSIGTSEFMAKVAVGDFRKAWEAMGNDNEVLEKFALQFKNQEDAVAAVIDYLGMQPCDGTGAIKPGGKPHMLHLSGVFVGGKSVLGRAQVALQGEAGGVILKIAVRSEEEGVSRMVTDCIN